MQRFVRAVSKNPPFSQETGNNSWLQVQTSNMTWLQRWPPTIHQGELKLLPSNLSRWSKQNVGTSSVFLEMTGQATPPHCRTPPPEKKPTYWSGLRWNTSGFPFEGGLLNFYFWGVCADGRVGVGLTSYEAGGTVALHLDPTFFQSETHRLKKSEILVLESIRETTVDSQKFGENKRNPKKGSPLESTFFSARQCEEFSGGEYLP